MLSSYLGWKVICRAVSLNLPLKSLAVSSAATDTTYSATLIFLFYKENLNWTNVTMSKDNEVDMKDVELNDMDQEKQPMTGGAANGDASSPTCTEKNGSVKVKIPEETETKFTGLSKEELLRVAGTPG